MGSYNRRLPIYLLLDCSESMAGEPFLAVVSGLSAMLGDLRNNPMALETAALSVITFASSARQVVPLTEILKFQVPKLIMGSGTALGAALELWRTCMTREVMQTSADQKGDYKPLCFILTDGEPTDAWERAADAVRNDIVGKKANVIAVALGPDADVNVLRRVTETVLSARDLTSGTFANFFKWVSASVSTASQKLEGAGEKGLALPGLPREVVLAQKRHAGEAPDPDRHVFLHARCVGTGKFYLMRFAKAGNAASPEQAIYTGVAAHALDNFEETDDTNGGHRVASGQLLNAPPCPYCGNSLWAMCRSGHVHCCPPYYGTLTCPRCNVTESYSSSNFTLGGGRG